MGVLDIDRLTVKLYADAAPPPTELVGIFHRWIQDDALPYHLPIDVADYRHVHRGPGILLVCHAGTFAFDDSDGRPGLRYRRRRRAFVDAPLADALRSLAGACERLQGAVAGGLGFARDELLLQIDDRLRAPRHPATLTALRAELASRAGALFGGGATLRLEVAGDGGDPFAARVLIDAGAGPAHWRALDS